MAQYISLNAQCEELQTELNYRAGVYPRLISSGKERESILNLRNDRLRAALRSLQWLKEHEDLIKHRLA